MCLYRNDKTVYIKKSIPFWAWIWLLLLSLEVKLIIYRILIWWEKCSLNFKVMFKNGLLFWSFPAPRRWISWFVLPISPMVYSFLLQFILQLTTQSCVLSPLGFPGVFVRRVYLPFPSYSLGPATTVWCFRTLVTWRNFDDLLKHKFWFQQGSLLEMDVKFTYNCLPIKNLLQTLSFFQI